MAKALTFSQAQARFGPLVTNGIVIEDAIQEAVDRIYEMGRWPGTTEEVLLGDDEFTQDADTGEWFVIFAETVYDGAIGFRNRTMGWSIMDQIALYKDGVNSGDREFIDFGTITVDGVDFRKYRCPIGFTRDFGPYYVLMKKEAPTLEAEDIIPVPSMGALKCAIQAVCFEFVNDDQRALAKWGSFDQFIKLSEKQVSGVKRFYLGMDSSLARKPKQFY
jgi:hypothetical protein